MSAQLILLPQTFLGVNSGSSSGTEIVSDGNQFLTLGAPTSSYANGTANPLHAIMSLSAGPISPNVWYRWNTNTSGGGGWQTPAAPSNSSNNIKLNSVAGNSASGVIQKLSNLVVGGSYTASIEIVTPAVLPIGPTHSVRIVIYNSSGNIIHTFTVPTGQYGIFSTTFIATANDNIITVSNYETQATNLFISKISAQSSIIQPLGEGNGQVICDLYQEEDIPLTLSIDEFKNVAEQVKSYSKSFSLPATKRNNRIFNNMFDVTRADDGYIFNPYVKTACILKQDGFTIFEGFLKLIDVKDKEGQISYNVNLYSDVIALAEVLENRTFADLNFSELDHDYTFVNIKNSWDNVLALNSPLPSGSFAGTAGDTTTNVLQYPFIDWNHQYSIDTVGNPILSTLESSFRPCIKLRYLIDNIFAGTEFNYTSSFFSSNAFGELFMDFNWGAGNVPVTFNNSFDFISPLAQSVYSATGAFTTLIPASPWFGSVPTAEFGFASGVFTAQEDNQTYDVSAFLPFQRTSGSGLDSVTVELVVNGVAISSQTLTSSFTATQYATFNPPTIGPMLAGDTWFFRATSNEIHMKFGGAGPNSILTVATSVTNYTDSALLQTLRGELGQWQFLKGIMTMFNLVSMKDENNPANILIEPYNDIFLTNSNTKELDWTDKVDISEMSLKPLSDLNKNTIFKFVEDDDDYVFQLYKQATTGHLYGSKKIDASVSAYGFPTVLQGTKEIIAEPFAATVSKQLESMYNDFIVPAVYAVNDEGISEGFDNSPRIFYRNGKKTLENNVTYSVPLQNGGAAVPDEDQFLQFSHFGQMPNQGDPDYEFDYVFESQQLFPGLGVTPVINLYSVYWQPYFSELYNADTRLMSLKVNLTPADIASFNFYDKIFIRNRIFRVNKIEYKPNSLATIEFILIP
jgi:hypothetical protein